MGIFHVPLDRIHSTVPDSGNHAVIIVTVGWAEQVGANAGDRLDLAVAAVQLRLDLVGAQLGEISVVVGMVHDLVSRIVQRLYRFRIFVHPFSHHKKGGFNVVFSQNINQLLGVLITPG